MKRSRSIAPPVPPSRYTSWAPPLTMSSPFVFHRQFTCIGSFSISMTLATRARDRWYRPDEEKVIITTSSFQGVQRSGRTLRRTMIVQA